MSAPERCPTCARPRGAEFPVACEQEGSALCHIVAVKHWRARALAAEGLLLRAEATVRIRERGNQTRNPNEVTCRRCMVLMLKADLGRRAGRDEGLG